MKKLVMAGLIGALAVGSAHAQTANLACTVSPSTTGFCNSNVPASEYSVRMQVPSPTTTSYIWNRVDINTGNKALLNCTTATCYFSVSAAGKDIDWTVTATANTGRNAPYYTTDLSLAAVCGGGTYFC